RVLAEATAPGVEVLVQGLVLDVVPADAHTQAQAPAREDVHRRGLLGHQRGLALGQDDDAGHELEALSERSEVAEQDEDLVERALVGVGWAATELIEALQLAAQHVVEDEQMIVARALGRLGVVADHHGVRADFRLGKHHAESHVVFSSLSGSRWPSPRYPSLTSIVVILPMNPNGRRWRRGGLGAWVRA